MTNHPNRSKFAKAKKAADAILAPVTMHFGRYLDEAPDVDLIPLLAEEGVKITAGMFKALYDATDD